MSPLPDQDVICLDIARAKICSKIDLSDAYEQICIIPEDMHKMAFATIYGTFVSNVMQQGNCNKVNCLGHMIDEKGLHMDADKMAKIRDWNRLCNFNNIQRFLGLVQYLAHFLPDITLYTGPLVSMTMNGTPFYWKPLRNASR